MSDLQASVDNFASVFRNAWDADDMWRGMQWSEALAIGELLFQGGYGTVAEAVVSWWLHATNPTEADLAELLPLPTDKLREWSGGA